MPARGNSSFNPDSAVAIGQEVRGTILPQRSRWVCASEPAIAQRRFNGSFKPHSEVVRERKITLKFHSRTPSLLQESTSLPAFWFRLRNPGSSSSRSNRQVIGQVEFVSSQPSALIYLPISFNVSGVWLSSAVKSFVTCSC